MPRLADRMAHLSPYVFQAIAWEMARMRARGEDVVDLGISDPDVAPSWRVVARLAGATANPRSHRYPPYRGSSGLRRAVAAWYRKRFDVVRDPEREVWITLGSKEALVHLTLALVNPGEVVLVPDPGYPSYRMAGALFGARTVDVPLSPAPDFLPDVSRLPPADAERARVWYVNYPNNPTGALAPLGAMHDWVAFCQRHDTVLVSDLAYAELVYDGCAHSVLEVPGAKPYVLESITWSKGHSLQGWRVGALVGSASLIEAVGRVEANVNAGVFLAIQDAAAEALAHDDPDTFMRRYRARRDLVVARLAEAGIVIPVPPAAVYCWVPAPGGDGDALARTALAAGVAVAPGSAFGPLSRRYVRLSLTHPDDVLARGLDRLDTVWADSLKPGALLT